MTLDEPIQIFEYDPQWPTVFSNEKQRLCCALVQPLQNIEHIGSTAVVGLNSKPIIDMILGVSSFPPSTVIISKITALNYENLGAAGVPDRLYFRRRNALAINLHVTQFMGDLWCKNLAVRDYLRSHTSACDSYAKVKYQAVASGKTMLLAYSDAKAALHKLRLSAALR